MAPTCNPAANPLKVTDLTTGEIVEALDICNRESPHDTETIGTLYAELNRRRRPI